MIEFTVPGVPVQKGSMKCICVRGHGRVIADRRKDLKAYQESVAEHALAAGATRYVGSVAVEVEFHLPRPMGHYGTGRNAGVLKESARLHPSVAPDLDKYQRSVGDALSKVAWDDDAQVVEWKASKRYAGITGPRTVIRIRSVNE